MFQKNSFFISMKFSTQCHNFLLDINNPFYHISKPLAGNYLDFFPRDRL